MNALIIIFDESKEHLYKVSIQENKNSKGQKMAQTKDEIITPRFFVFQRITPAASDIKVAPIATTSIKNGCFSEAMSVKIHPKSFWCLSQRTPRLEESCTNSPSHHQRSTGGKESASCW